ncbi:RNA polymerase sigma factor [Hymenobacter sp. M29]|uniref:RNA polymerase sigma factor n=1 Tax=Hymenobacter mellowenesis TaxID=3063995 RepID=A0ABT9AKD4_9BACT|nr:RNA polymerase sigma factor [Hymenobacter sp. M29]MDO7849947.1 RNA polymerase sigma factor [Hymenobacter sp. M29]
MPSVEEELVRRLLARDGRAMTEFYQLYHAALCAAVRRLLRNAHTAEDVVQVGMLKVWQGIALYDPAQGRLFTWAARICCNSAIDYLRTGRHQLATRTGGLDNAGAHALAVSGFQPDHIGVADLLQGLRPEYRQVMDLVYLQGYTQLEAAELLNVPLGTVKTWMGRSRELLGRMPL